MQQTSAVALRLDALPREIDAPLRFRLRFEPMYGWAVAISLLCIGCFLYIAVYCDLADHSDDTVIAQGKITAVEEVIVRTKRGPRVERYVVTATYPGGSVVSHFLDTSPPEPRVGAQVDILGDGDPKHVVIAGGRLRHGKLLFPLLFSLFPFIFYLCSFAIHLLVTQRHLSLLLHGKEGVATFVREKPARKGPPARVYEFFDGKKTKTLVNKSPGKHDSDAQEPILFDRWSAVFLESLPGHLRIERGRFVAREPATLRAGAFAIAAMPLLVALCAAALWYGEVRTVADLLRAMHPRHW
jgi:hypothetical protein